MMNFRSDRTSRSGRLSFALLIWSLALAASAGASRLQPQDLKMDGYPAVGGPPIVTVLSPGAEPRTRLRYTIASGYKDHMSMSMLMSMAMEMAGTSMPPMQMPLMKMGADLNVTDVAPSGDISYTFAFTDMNVDSTAGVDPAVTAAMQGIRADFKNVKGTGTVSNRGITRAFSLDVSKIDNPTLKQTMGSVSTTMQNMSSPLPEEAIGVGARCEVRQSVASGGVQAFSKTVFELVGLDPNIATLKTTVETTAPPQAMSSPALPPEADVRLQKYTGTGTGTMTMHLDSLVPTSEVAMQQSMVMEINMAGTAQIMSTAMTLKMGISSPDPSRQSGGTQPGAARPETTSLLGRPLYPVQSAPEAQQAVEATVQSAREALAKAPDSADAILWYGRRAAIAGHVREAIDVFTRGLVKFPADARFYRHRGHRFVTLREFDKAIADLTKASQLIAGKPDEQEPSNADQKVMSSETLHYAIYYHLGLAHYLKGDFARALPVYRQCLAAAKGSDDETAGASDWLYMTLRRLGRTDEAAKVLDPIVPGMKVKDDQQYYDRLLMYKGLRKPEDLLAAGGDPVSAATLQYGVANWYLYNGRKDEAKAIFEKIITGPNWMPFGFIAAEAELARMK